MFDHLKTIEEKYEAFVHFVANDYYELSYDKVKWQRDEYRKLANKIVEEAWNEKHSRISPKFNDDF